MDYTLAKKLKEAGFPQMYKRRDFHDDEGDVYIPTLSQLVEVCDVTIKIWVQKDIKSAVQLEGESLDDIIHDEIEILRDRGFLKTGDVAVSTGSTPVHLHLPTNTLKITKLD